MCVLLVTALVSACVPALAEMGISKELTYEEAKKSLALENYRDAIDAFNELGTYQDSVNYRIYASALLSLSEGEFQDSIDQFNVLASSQFLDSDKYLLYAQGRMAESRALYDQAIQFYSGLGFLDSNMRILDLMDQIGAGPTCTPSPLPSEPTPSPAPPKPYIFVDPEVEKILRGILGKEAGEDIYLSDLERVTVISEKEGTKKGVHYLDDLSNCPNLTEIMMNDNRISDLSPLSKLPGLRRLWVKGNAIIDLTPLSEVTSLTNLGINHNQISDLSPLKNLTELESLYINSNKGITSLEPLAGLTKLAHFQYGNNKLKDSEVKNFKSLHPNCKMVYKKK
jgi:tetratricopeptide (TPR) repeat protein